MNKTIKKRQEKERKILLENLSKTPIIQMACEKTGISRATYYRWLKSNKKFAKDAEKAIEEGVSLMNDFAESQLISSIRDRNMTAIIYWLKHRHKAYSTKIELGGHVKTSSELNEYQEKLLQKAIKLVFGGEDE